MLSRSKMPVSDRHPCSPGLRTVTRGEGDLRTDFPHAAMRTKIQKKENECLYSGVFYNLERSSKDERGNGFYGWLAGEPWLKGWFWESMQRKWLLAHGSHYDTDGVCGWHMNVTRGQVRAEVSNDQESPSMLWCEGLSPQQTFSQELDRFPPRPGHHPTKPIDAHPCRNQKSSGHR